jgi:PPM family protein phosphatase
VGDSRVYRLRDCRLEQLTFDHSLQWELRRHGRVAENSDLARSIPKNVITRSLGPHSEVSVDLEGPYSLQAGDTFLLCSDGLTGQVSDAELAELLAYLPPEEAAAALIHLANLRGGADNTTVIVVKIVDDAVLADAAPEVTPVRAHLPASSLVCLPLAGVGLFISLFLWLAEQAVPAAILALAGLGALIAAAVLWYRRRREERAAVSTGEKLGSGPYAHHTFKHGDTIVRTLSSILDQLREAATESRWNVPWQQVDGLRRQAEAAAAAHQFPEAVRQFAAAISFVMVELRRPGRKKGPDPGLEYRSR